MTSDPLPELDGVLATCTPGCIAVSGGVDSMTLAAAAHRRLGHDVAMVHAVSPAVPPAATARVRQQADAEGWALSVVDAGEFRDEAYLANPADRCFFCKTSLYGTLARLTERTLLSGTNTDDLGDWRPGLRAARAHGVRHPYVEAGIDKAGVRVIARRLGLTDIAELPAAPCLSSRVETGLRIDPAVLRAIDRAETLLRERLGGETVRCRMRHSGVVVELDPVVLGKLDAKTRSDLARRIAEVFAHDDVTFEPYRRGSAFLRRTVG